nr:hypothetical protein [Streptomyces sp. 5-10]
MDGAGGADADGEDVGETHRCGSSGAFESGAGRLDAFGVAVLGGHLDAVAAADGADEVGAQRQDLVDPDVDADHGPVLGAETVALGGPADGPRCVRIRDDLGEEFTLDQLVDGVLGRCAGDSRPVGDLGEGEAPRRAVLMGFGSVGVDHAQGRDRSRAAQRRSVPVLRRTLTHRSVLQPLDAVPLGCNDPATLEILGPSG